MASGDSDIAAVLEKEAEWVERLEGSLARSAELKDGMIAILDAFEQHLQKLDATVNPLYQETNRLQTKQANISQALDTVTTRIEFYTIADEMDTTIRDSDPSQDLQKYLKNMRKLKKALEFFATQSASEVEQDSVRNSLEQGFQSLEQLFKATLNRASSKELGSTILLAAVADDYEVVPNALRPTDLIAPSDTAKLATVAEFLIKNSRKSFLEHMALNRCMAMQKAIDKVSGERRTAANALASGPRVSTGVSPKADRKISAPAKSNVRKFSRAPIQSVVAGEQGSSYRRSNTMNPEALVEEDEAGREAETFLLLLAAFRALLQAETGLLRAVVKSERLEQALFPKLVDRPFHKVLDAADTCLAAVRKLLNKGEFGGVLCLCPVSHYLHTHDDALSTLAKSGKSNLLPRYSQIVEEMDKLIVVGCNDFVDFVKTDVDKLVPRDGTVHQRTSNTLSLMKQLLDERESISPLLARHPGAESAEDGAGPAEPRALPKLFTRILSALGLNLRTKANSYTEPTHRDLFQLNNFNHILRTLSATGVLAVASEQNHSIASYYESQITKHREAFVSAWTTLAHALGPYSEHVPPPGHALTEKERGDVKAAFAAFNKELEELDGAAKEMSVPDSELASGIRRDIKEAVLHKYSAFYNTFKSSKFTKNPDKYMKIMPETLASIIDRLFDGQAHA